MKRGLWCAGLSVLFISANVLAEEKKPEKPTYKVMVMDPADGKVFKKNNMDVELSPDSQQAISRASMRGESKSWWPLMSERKRVLAQVPELDKLSKQLKWDDYAVDEFIAQAARMRASEAALSQKYPQVSKNILSKSMLVSRKVAGEGKSK